MQRIFIVLLLLVVSLPSFAYDTRNDLIQHYQSKTNQVESEMLKIAMNYPAASLAWVATSGSLAAVFTNTMTEDEKALWMLGGLFGAGYCASSANKCAIMYF